MKGSPYIDERLFECRATFLEETAEPLRKKVKTKRRNRKTKTVKSKHRYSVLTIKELIINVPPAVAVAAGGGTSEQGGLEGYQGTSRDGEGRERVLDGTFHN